MKVVGYARVSTEKQKDEATIETQVERIKRFCKEKGYDLSHIYLDDGISGRTTRLKERPQGFLLLAAANRQEFQAVVCYHPDRLGRRQSVSEEIVEQLWDDLRIRIFDVNNGTDITTPQGRLLFTIVSAMGVAECSRFAERSIDGTLLAVEKGAWLGGIVPYGYRVEGKKKQARLRLSVEKIEGFDVSEVEVVQMMYRWSADDGLSCFKIAAKLEAMGIPTSYARDTREILSHKRKVNTQNLWRAGRVRNMLVETTYKGTHRWGKRRKKKRPTETSLTDTSLHIFEHPINAPRPIIERPVDPIVDAETWERAQKTLTKNRMISQRNSKRQYLLRAKMKCALCSLTYAGSVSRAGKASNLQSECRHPSYEIKNGYILRPYYCCTGKSNFRGIYGQKGERCPSRMVSSQIVEKAVWADIEEFLRNPDDVLDEIQTKLAQGNTGSEQFRKDLSRFKNSLEGVEAEKDKVLALFRKNVIDEDTLVSQLTLIEKSRANLEIQIGQVETEIAQLDNQQQQCQTTQQLLLRLNHILDGEMTFEDKREIVEALVDWIRVDTQIDGKKKTVSVEVFYRFGKPDSNRGPTTLTEIGGDVRADSCSTAGKPSPNPAPAPPPRSEGISRE